MDDTSRTAITHVRAFGGGLEHNHVGEKALNDQQAKAPRKRSGEDATTRQGTLSMGRMQTWS